MFALAAASTVVFEKTSGENGAKAHGSCPFANIHQVGECPPENRSNSLLVQTESEKPIIYPTRKNTVELNFTEISSVCELDRMWEAGENAAIWVTKEEVAKDFLSRQHHQLTNQRALTQSECLQLAEYLEIKVDQFAVPLTFGGGHHCTKCNREMSWIDFAHLAITRNVHTKKDLTMLMTGEYEGKYLHFAFGGKFWVQCFQCDAVNDLPKEQVKLLGASVRYIL